MTRFLASVTGLDEAMLALAHGADVIDLKNPARGALGAVATHVIGETVAAVAGRRAVSAVAGDLPMQPAQVTAAVREIAATGVDYVKIGIFPGGDAPGCLRALTGAAAKVKLIAVFFADAEPDLTLLPAIADAGFAGVMIDTRRKGEHRLLDHFDLPRLQGFVQAGQAARLLVGLAGALETPDIPRLLLLAPDLLGFRGALCGSMGRTGGLDISCLQTVRGLIPPEGRARAHADVDYRLLAARGYAPGAAGDAVQTDRVIVEEFVLPVSIGAYAHERAARQRVRFAVDVSVARPMRAAEDMRDVFSYDLVTDGILLLTEAGHFALTETLAERIAEMVLTHSRVMRVIVGVQKLDTGLARVGVQIERTRSVSQAAVPLLAEGARLS
jgi:dihydroneopterin aldolase